MPLLIFCYIRTLKTILVWTSDPLIPLCWLDPLSPGACRFTVESQLLAPGLHTPSTFQFCRAIHSLPSIFSRIYRALGHSLFPVCPSSLWRLVSGLHKLGFIDQLISSRFQPIGGTSRRSIPLPGLLSAHLSPLFSGHKYTFILQNLTEASSPLWSLTCPPCTECKYYVMT